MCFFFFFKQKTAYEMRISDWSSDVCSSDLRDSAGFPARPGRPGSRGLVLPFYRPALSIPGRRFWPAPDGGDGVGVSLHHVGKYVSDRGLRGMGRSEEHTSELQSLMRISYAVFCLKKKKHINTLRHTNNKRH